MPAGPPPYAAPEVARPLIETIAGDVSIDGASLCFTVLHASEMLCLGDRFIVSDNGLQRFVFQVEFVRPTTGGGQRVVSVPDAAIGDMRAHFCIEEPAKVTFLKQTSFASDIHSLGMILAALLLCDDELVDFTADLRNVERELAQAGDMLDALPARALTHWLRARETQHLQTFFQCVDRLQKYGADMALAEELLGIAVKATVRADSPLFYLAHRGADAGRALARLRYDFGRVENAQRTASLRKNFERLQQEQVEAISRLYAAAEAAQPEHFSRTGAFAGESQMALAIDCSVDPAAVEQELRYLQMRSPQPDGLAGTLASEYLRLQSPGGNPGARHAYRGLLDVLPRAGANGVNQPSEKQGPNFQSQPD